MCWVFIALAFFYSAILEESFICLSPFYYCVLNFALVSIWDLLINLISLENVSRWLNFWLFWIFRGFSKILPQVILPCHPAFHDFYSFCSIHKIYLHSFTELNFSVKEVFTCLIFGFQTRYQSQIRIIGSSLRLDFDEHLGCVSCFGNEMERIGFFGLLVGLVKGGQVS